MRGRSRLDWLRRLLRPRRTIWPTRDGWWCLFAATGLGVAAINTGNNLLYLLASMLLGLVLVSGVLSEAAMRGLRLVPVLPEEIHAGRPALLGGTIANRKRWIPSHSLCVEILEPGARPHAAYLARLGAGEERLITWEATLPRRGRRRLAGVRVTTRFPFGVFLKAGQVLLDTEVLVYPALGRVPAELLRQVGGSGPAHTRRRGRGSDLHNLRDYREGDDPRLIHWRSSAKTQALTVRELEAETSTDTRIVLEGLGARDAARLEGGLSEAASLAMRLLRAGTRVELVGPGLLVALGRGRGQERRILTALALYEPGQPPSAGSPAAPVGGSAALREIRIGIG
jgi:uncharacterized protein (DUF58 family)